MSLSKKGFFHAGIMDAGYTRSTMGGASDFIKLYRKVSKHIRWASDRINNKESVYVSVKGFTEIALKAVLQSLITSKYTVTPMVDTIDLNQTVGILIKW
jgi:hypothetical protein